MTINEELKQIGLKNNEINIYLLLLSRGLSTPPQIAKQSGIARPNCYAVLTTLISKGLITQQTKGRRKTYLANDPTALLQTMQARTERLTQCLPDLKALFLAQKNKPSIRFFETPEQIKEIFYEMLEAKEVLGIASTKKLYAALTPDFFKKYINQMQKRGIFLRDILTADSVPTSAPTPIGILKSMYDYRVLDEKFGDIPVDILIWDNKIAFISVEIPIFGTIIENPAIAKMLKIMFELSWEKLSI